MALVDLIAAGCRNPPGFCCAENCPSPHVGNSGAAQTSQLKWDQLQWRDEGQEGTEDAQMLRAGASAQVKFNLSRTRLLFHFPC